MWVLLRVCHLFLPEYLSGVNKYDLNKYCRILAKEYSFADKLNFTARQFSAERAWSAISRFFDSQKISWI
jgi:hypothetical protein